jgi:uncharacterized damage-inducible protein DinB
MPVSDPLDILLAHDLWATKTFLHVCEKLTPEQFSRKFDMGLGSLQATLTHILGAMQTWTDTLMGRPLSQRIDQNGQHYTPAQLLELQQRLAAEFAAAVRAAPLDQIARRSREGREFAFTRGTIAMQVLTHGMHHRAQCLNMMKQLGVHPLPPSSVAEWSRMSGG